MIGVVGLPAEVAMWWLSGGALLLALLTWGWVRSASSGRASAALAPGLERELWRQSVTPRLGPGQESLLMPVLAFELMPLGMRRLYDRSRALDEALLSWLWRAPEARAQVRALQAQTRWVRRRLVELLARPGGEEVALEELEAALDEVEVGISPRARRVGALLGGPRRCA